MRAPTHHVEHCFCGGLTDRADEMSVKWELPTGMHCFKFFDHGMQLAYEERRARRPILMVDQRLFGIPIVGSHVVMVPFNPVARCLLAQPHPSVGAVRYNLSMEVPQSLTWLLDHTLPLNRKERFYTGTVLPGIVCANLPELKRLTALLGHPEVDVTSDPEDCGLVFFTEYGIAESAYGPASARFAGFSTARDTPDVVFLTMRPTPVLFALEAKMYDRPGGALRRQLDIQRELLSPLAGLVAEWLGVEEVPVAHAALLPAQQAATLALDPYPVITWQQLLATYDDIAPPYWRRMLTEALDRYDDLVSRAVSNDADRMTGQAIVDRFEAGDFEFSVMGRSAGLTGAPLQADIESGAWRATVYQVARRQPGNRNWFAIEAFVALVAQQSGSTADALADFRGAVTTGASIVQRVFGDDSVATAIAAAPAATFDGISTDDIRRVTAAYRSAAEAAQEARAQAADLFHRASHGDSPA
jgi:hypothetical protein